MTASPLPVRASRRRTSVLSLVLLAALVAACSEKPPPAVPEPPDPILQNRQLRFVPGHPHLAQLQLAPAKPATTLMLELPAKLVWNEERTQRVFPAFSGRVQSIEADIGRSVTPGSVLARVASPEFGAAQADVAKASADADLTRKALARQRELLEIGVAPRRDVEQAEADAARAQAELARAQARVALYGGGAGVDQQLTLRASLAGLVVERNLNPGQELRPEVAGPGVPALFVVSDPSLLWVQIDAREGDAGTLRPGSAFQLEVPSIPDQRFEGRVVAVADAIDPVTRTVKVRGVVPNRDRRLRAEMLATARFERSVGNGVLVPAAAVQLVSDGHRVFVQSAPGVFEPRAVKLGWQGPQEVLVTSGLEVGETVVGENMLLLARVYRLSQDAQRPAAAEKGDAKADARPAAKADAKPEAKPDAKGTR